jgi:uncharacterized membrane protein
MVRYFSLTPHLDFHGEFLLPVAVVAADLMPKVVLAVVCKARQEPTTAAISVVTAAHNQQALEASASVAVVPLVAVVAAAVTGVAMEASPTQAAAADLVGPLQIFNLLHTREEKILATVLSPSQQHKMQQSRRQQTLLQLVGTIAFMCHGRRQQIRKQLVIALDGVHHQALLPRS